jgi:hypothetical protein
MVVAVAVPQQNALDWCITAMQQNATALSVTLACKSRGVCPFSGCNDLLKRNTI